MYMEVKEVYAKRKDKNLILPSKYTKLFKLELNFFEKFNQIQPNLIISIVKNVTL